jgi:hypothetical protein
MSRLLLCLSLFFLSTVLTADELPVDPPFSTDGLVLWLNADHHEAEDNRVITWFDRSDHGNHLTQNDPQLRPLVSQLDGNTAIHFKKSSGTFRVSDRHSGHRSKGCQRHSGLSNQLIDDFSAELT